MMTIEASNTHESRMAFTYRKAVGDIESASKDIWKYVRVKSVDGQLVPYFLPEAETPLSALESAEKRLVENQSDMKKYITAYSLQDQYVHSFCAKKFIMLT